MDYYTEAQQTDAVTVQELFATEAEAISRQTVIARACQVGDWSEITEWGEALTLLIETRGQLRRYVNYDGMGVA